jgi:copper chaperone CopZ
MITQSYTVTGLHCNHCVASVTEELTELPGVREVVVDLPTGHVEVHSDRVLDTDEVHRAVVGAGFQVRALAG